MDEICDNFFITTRRSSILNLKQSLWTNWLSLCGMYYYFISNCLNFSIVLQELSADVLKERKALIRKLQTQLRNEEMSLVLLKKIRQSQVMADQAKAAEAAKVSIQPTSRQSQSNHGTPPPQAGHAHNSVAGSKNRTGGAHSSVASISNARSGGGQNMKNILTPDLSILKPVSAVSIYFCKWHSHEP